MEIENKIWFLLNASSIGNVWYDWIDFDKLRYWFVRWQKSKQYTVHEKLQWRKRLLKQSVNDESLQGFWWLKQKRQCYEK